MSRKALFFDIDGTLLTDGSKELPESAAESIVRARENGHLVFINSGRARCLMKEVEDCLAVDGYLCGCGTYIEIGGKTALRHVLSKKRRMELQHALLEYKMDGMLEGPSGCFVCAGASHTAEMEHVKKMVARSNALFETDWLTQAVPFDKFCALTTKESDVPGFLSAMGPDMAPIDRGHGLYECVPAGFDKATAMEFILRYFGIPWEESYAFGDSTNDLAMIKYARHGVVMGHHAKELEPYADFITKDVEDDGIAFALKELGIV